MADSGRFVIQLPQKDKPQSMASRDKSSCSQPYKGLRVAVCGNLTAETAFLVETYNALGAEVRLCSSTMQDPVAAAIIASGSATLFSWHEEYSQEHRRCIDRALDWGNGGGPHLILGPDEISEKPVGVSKEIISEAKKLYEDVYMAFSKSKMGLSFADHGEGSTYQPGLDDDDDEVAASPSVANLGADDHHESTNDTQPEIVSTLSINGGDHSLITSGADDGIEMGFGITSGMLHPPRNRSVYVILVILLTAVAGMVSKIVFGFSFGST